MYNAGRVRFCQSAMLCTSLTVLLAACGGGNSGTDAGQTQILSSANANPKSNGYAAPATTTATTTSPTTTTTTSPTTTTTTSPTTTTTTTTTTASTTTTTTANNFYVATTGSDSNSGTQSAPFRTIQYAASVVKPGTTVHVAPGTYAETITTTVSGTASARIIYVSDTKWGAKIVPTAGAYAMWTASGGYTDIVGFQVDGSGSTSIRLGIALNGGNSSVQNSSIHHVALTSGCDNLGGAGLHASQSRGSTFNNYDFTGNVVHDIGGTCTYIPAIYHQSSGNIKNNMVYSSAGAIQMYHDDHNINVVNNTVFGNAGYGIIYGGCQEAYNNGCPTSGIKIYNNIIYDNTGGIQGPITANDVNNEVKYNLVYGNSNQFDLASPSASTFTGMVIANPLFTNYIKTGGGDYHLQSGSPAIDKGTSTYAPMIDLDGVARPRGAAFDIGAFEY